VHTPGTNVTVVPRRDPVLIDLTDASTPAPSCVDLTSDDTSQDRHPPVSAPGEADEDSVGVDGDPGGADEVSGGADVFDTAPVLRRSSRITGSHRDGPAKAHKLPTEGEGHAFHVSMTMALKRHGLNQSLSLPIAAALPSTITLSRNCTKHLSPSDPSSKMLGIISPVYLFSPAILFMMS